MQTITYSEARQNLASLMARTVNNVETITITRTKGESCVLMSLAEFEALTETAYLLRSPANARHLLASIEELRNGKVVERELKDEI
ncbi:YoeB-YefM toxin-antitoxin system antitoxin YefM [Lonepinella sp. MS14435]|uniref:YoeB-YefM toxin-antitoxin system antitoxin YefM n=1 Tax=unclassified Lonepinella TaxID=2642006 RepID=UPI0036DEA72D